MSLSPLVMHSFFRTDILWTDFVKLCETDENIPDPERDTEVFMTDLEYGDRMQPYMIVYFTAQIVDIILRLQ